ncbi:8035_t:CDS:2 [Scutellospora calospora]|uniref:8035_t:CDS:1 n=1 Tax=Scutellospora calospora TaxID=85575 RepID=A0ACA9KG26_9GLOM|nr:8035_t:CDS:2 [Scutellospora calospora]
MVRVKVPNELIFYIVSYLYDIEKSLFKYVLVSRDWARIVIPFLWENSFHNENFKIDSLKRIIYCNLSSDKRDLYSEFFLEKYHARPLFNYLSFAKKINTLQIKNIFVDYKNIQFNLTGIIKTVVNLLLKSSNLIEFIHIHNKFDFFEMVNGYMKDHKISLSLYNQFLKLDMLENLDNLTSLSLSSTYLPKYFDSLFDKISITKMKSLVLKSSVHNRNLIENIIKLQNLKSLSLINSIHDFGDFLLIKEKMKNLVYLKIISFKVNPDTEGEYLINEFVKHENLKILKVRFDDNNNNYEHGHGKRPRSNVVKN